MKANRVAFGVLDVTDNWCETPQRQGVNGSICKQYGLIKHTPGAQAEDFEVVQDECEGVLQENVTPGVRVSTGRASKRQRMRSAGRLRISPQQQRQLVAARSSPQHQLQQQARTLAAPRPRSGPSSSSPPATYFTLSLRVPVSSASWFDSSPDSQAEDEQYEEDNTADAAADEEQEQTADTTAAAGMQTQAAAGSNPEVPVIHVTPAQLQDDLTSEEEPDPNDLLALFDAEERRERRMAARAAAAAAAATETAAAAAATDPLEHASTLAATGGSGPGGGDYIRKLQQQLEAARAQVKELQQQLSSLELCPSALQHTPCSTADEVAAEDPGEFLDLGFHWSAAEGVLKVTAPYGTCSTITTTSGSSASTDLQTHPDGYGRFHIGRRYKLSFTDVELTAAAPPEPPGGSPITFKSKPADSDDPA